MRAASSVSRGKLRALFLKYIIRNGVAMLGRMKPVHELMSFALVNIWNKRNENRHKRHHHRQHQNRHHGVLRLVVIGFQSRSPRWS